jgi:hypothetical protein
VTQFVTSINEGLRGEFMNPEEIAENLPTYEDISLISELLWGAAGSGALGKCEDNLNDKGHCAICTALTRLDFLHMEMNDGNVSIVVNEK